MLTRGKLAKQANCHIETIRYYEKNGLLPEPERTPAGYRIYEQEHLARLRFIQKSKTLGFSLQRIRELLDLSDQAELHTRADVKALTEIHIREISDKISDLEKLRERLIETASHCDGAEESAEECPILVALFDQDSSD